MMISLMRNSDSVVYASILLIEPMVHDVWGFIAWMFVSMMLFLLFD
jgi:hypothetical protein